MNVKGAVLALSVGLSLVGCGGADSSYGTIYVRTINLVRGASSVFVSTDSGAFGTTVAYASPTVFEAVSAIPQAVLVKDLDTNVTIGTAGLSQGTSTFYTLYATGVEGGAPAPSVSIVPETVPTSSTTSANVRFGNFSTALNQPVDVYVTAVGSTTALSALTPIFSSVSYGTVGSYLTVTGGNYRIRVTAAGSKSSVLVDIPTVTFVNAKDYSLFSTDASSSTAGLISNLDTY